MLKLKEMKQRDGAEARFDRADVVLFNGKIVTANAAFTTVEALAIKDGRFMAVGHAPNVMSLVDERTQCIDLAGRTVLPGLIDTHAHVEKAGLLRHVVRLDDVRTVDQALQRISAQVSKVPHGQWIRGGAWHPVAQLVERRYLTRRELDAVAPDHPVCLAVGHFTMVNSRALSLASVTRDTPDPDGGIIHREPDGELTGLLEERAEDLIHDLLPDWTDEERASQLREAMAYFNANGLTSAISAAVDPATFRAHAQLRQQRTATLRISAMYAPTGGLNPTLPLAEWEAFFSRIGAVSDFGDDWLSYSGVKLQIDGGMTLRTAAMRDGYPHDRSYHGTIVIEPQRFNALVAVANRYGWRVGVHAVGDAAVDRVLDAFEAADKERSIRDRRFIVIHGSLIQKDQMERAKRLGVRVDAQSAFLWDKAAAVASHLGKPTADRAFPMRTMIDTMGMDLVAQGTDYPINELSPFINMSVMITRRDRNNEVYGPDERISREEAIRLYTSAAARYAFAEESLGSIETGKLADLVVLSDDILTVPESAIKDIRVMRTIVGGKTVFNAEVEPHASSQPIGINAP